MDFHLNVGASLFLSQTHNTRLSFIKEVYNKYQKKSQVTMCLTQSHYAPYLLVQFIGKETFMRMTDFTLYEKCLEFSTQFELEELSKVQEIEDSFVKFLKYIEILN